MDGNRFDDITKRLAGGSSRRSFLKRATATVAALAGIGELTGTEAARRPTPTPKPIKCPGSQVASGGVCVCPSGTQCGSDCCQSGSTCCDGACCYGTCYAEEYCCPTGQLVCGGVCLAPGQCCADSDCILGFACLGNACVCQPSTSCATAGLNCGSFTDDCGNVGDCGSCTAPDTCENGVCTCVVTTACDGLCGNITTNCGTEIDCGGCTAPATCGGGGTPGVCGCTPRTECGDGCGTVDDGCNGTLQCDPCDEPPVCDPPCGPCLTCTADDTCTPVPNGGICGSGCDYAVCVDGSCSRIATVPCPPSTGSGQQPDSACHSYACVQQADAAPICQASPSNEGGTCEPLDACQTGVCSAGNCIGTDIECPLCHECRTGTCEAVTGNSCGDGFQCVDGGCYAFSGGNDLVDGTSADGICASLKCEDACCPGQSNSTCCDTMDYCFMYGGNGVAFSAYCCAAEDRCNGDCCYSTESCVDNTTCWPTDQICSDDSTCDEPCCGGDGSPGSGSCCGSAQQCNNGTCVDVDIHGCDSDAECLSPATCAGLVKVETQPGQFLVVKRGVCCLSDFTTFRQGNPICCSPGTYPSGQANFPCCAYGTGDCPSCTCSTASVRRWRR